MSPIAEKQIPTRKKYQHPADTKRNTSQEIVGKASKATVRVQKNNGFGHNHHYNGKPPHKQLEMDVIFNAARFIQSAHLALYRRNLDYYLENPDEFVERAVGVYRLLAAAESAVKSLKSQAKPYYESYLTPA